jgi:hypothetical protein
VIMRCLEKRPLDRHRSALSLLEALQATRPEAADEGRESGRPETRKGKRQEPSGAGRPPPCKAVLETPDRRPTDGGTPGDPPPSTADPARASGRRGAARGAALLLVLAGLGGWFGWSPRQTAAPPPPPAAARPLERPRPPVLRAQSAKKPARGGAAGRQKAPGQNALVDRFH